MIKRAQTWRKAFGCAWHGICYTFRRERSMKVHGGAALLVLALAYYYDLARLEWALLLVAVAAVFIAELLNTAVERIVDFISPGFRREAKIIKDVAAGASLTAAAFAAVIGWLLFADKIFS